MKNREIHFKKRKKNDFAKNWSDDDREDDWN